eukprot:TRINITY_DN32689_c0_g2_i2.p1 TRINITY_DN32689_c0_g2~~TRINITY_DN32689_c0_g2_i2.p1  ORF type:complete len:1177 (-),score=214.66 TRINITY_DN32689_c0_g2_i2:76-3606(-)
MPPSDQAAASLPVGARVAIGQDSLLVGTVRFVGLTQFAPDAWVGVELDKPSGKNDGSVNDVRYFSCQPRHGIFCRPDRLELLPESQAVQTLSAGAHSQSPGAHSLHVNDHSPGYLFVTGYMSQSPDATNSKAKGRKTKAKLQLKPHALPESDTPQTEESFRTSRDGDIVGGPIMKESPRMSRDDDIVVEERGEEEGSSLPVEGAQDAAWQAKLQQLASRGMKVGHLIGFYQSLAEGTLLDENGKQLMEHFDPTQHTTHDVVREAIIPATRSTPLGPCAYSSLAEDNRPVLATVMVSHHWRNLFSHLVAAVVAFALGKTSYEGVVQALQNKDFEDLRQQLDRRDVLQMTCWLCLFCVNQHASICAGLPPPPSVNSAKPTPADKEALDYYHRETHDPITGLRFELCSCGAKKHWNDSPDCEMDKFDAMMGVLDKEVPRAVHRKLIHMIVVDRSFEVFSRIWVMAEVAKGQELELSQVAMLFETEVADADKQSAKRRASVVPSSVASEMRRIGENLDIRKCKASRQEDVDAILATISDVDKFNSQLKSTLFDERSGLIETWSAERVAGFFDVMDPLKDLLTGMADVPAPQIVTLGQESTGKSTLLERLTGLPLFPRNADLCTRSLIKVRLRRGAVKKLRLLLQDFQTGLDEEPGGLAESQSEPPGNPKGNSEMRRSLTMRPPVLGRHLELEGLGQAVMEEMTRQVRLEALRIEFPQRSAGFYSERLSLKPLAPSDGLCTQKILVVELSSPTAPNLDVVDCPGLVAAAARGRPETLPKDTAELVRRYAKLHRQSALFVVAVKASEQPNNSLAMRLVQEMGLESRTMGVLTMTDVLTGDLTDGKTTLHSTFLKHHGPRLWQLLRGQSDLGGGVVLGLGYTLTALNDVKESRGWTSLSRIDAMAQWEQRFFAQLARQWPLAAGGDDADVPTADGLMAQCSCNNLWKHIKNAVDEFVREHWLVETIRVLCQEEETLKAEESALGYPRAMAPGHVSELRRQGDLLPGILRAAALLEDGETDGQVEAGEQEAQGVGAPATPASRWHRLGAIVSSQQIIRGVCAKMFADVFVDLLESMWLPSGFFQSLAARLDKEIMGALPDSLVFARPSSQRGQAEVGGVASFDLSGRCDQLLVTLEQLLQKAAREVRQHLAENAQSSLKKDKSSVQVARMSPAFQAVEAALWQG